MSLKVVTSSLITTYSSTAFLKLTTIRLKWWFTVIGLISSQLLFAIKSPDYIFNPADLDFDRLSAIEIGGVVKLGGKDIPHLDSQNLPMCQCGLSVGVPIVFWEPVMLAEIVSKAYRSPLLGSELEKLHNVGSGSHGSNSFYHVHLFDFFPLQMAQTALPFFAQLNDKTRNMMSGCLDGNDESVLETISTQYLSELDITHKMPLLSHIYTPEIAALTVQGAVESTMLSCSADSVMSLKNKVGTDTLYFCSGTRGFLFPLSGHSNRTQSALEDAVLNLERAIFKMHRRSVYSTSGKALGTCSKKAQCGPIRNFTPRKSQYAFQLLYPRPNKTLTLNWGEKPPKNSQIGIKQSEQDFVFLVWRKRNCCAR